MADEYNNGWNGQSWQPQNDDGHESSDSQGQASGDAAGGVNGTEAQSTQSGSFEGQGNEDTTQPLNTKEERTEDLTGVPNGGSDGSQAASDEQLTENIQHPQTPDGYYRPAPQYGAYAPTTPISNQTGAPYGAPAYGAPDGYAQPSSMSSDRQRSGSENDGNRNPYVIPTGNPFETPERQGSDQTGGSQQQQGAWGPGFPQGPQNNVNPQGSPVAKPRKTANGIVIAVVAALVSAALCLGVGYAALTQGWVSVPATGSLSSVSSNTSGSGTATAKSGTSVDWTSVAKDVSSSVVSIQTTLSSGTAKGSGAILDAKGYIVTNNHVISDATAIQVTLTNGQMYSAKVVGTDSTTDLAVIKLVNPPSNLTAVEFADSDNLAVGEAVMAIGNPLGYDDTATTGIVSALNRPVSVEDDDNSEIVTNAVQIDAAINPGNSGGPTFNSAGQVIGINSSIASTATSSSEAGSIGIGFAIPSNLVKKVANQIIKNGSAKHVMLGVTVTSDTVTADGVTRGGAKITSSNGSAGVVSGSPADKAGLKVGDTIVAFDGQAVGNSYSLLGFVRAASLNDKVTLTVVRDSKTITVSATLDQQEKTTSSSSSSGSGSSNDDNDSGNSGSGNSDGDSGGLVDPFGLW